MIVAQVTLGRLIASAIVAALATQLCRAGAVPLYLDASQPVEMRVQDLLARMTLEERQAELYSVHNVVPSVYADYANTSFGAQKLTGFTQTTAADLVAARNTQQTFFVEHSRLHIPLAWHQETLNSCGPGASLFPLPVNIGSSWNVSLARALGEVLGRECRALGIDAAYSPEVNLYTDPRNGRLQEGFSEDPRLTAELAVAQVLGEQGAGPGPLGPRTYLPSDKVGAVGKHYVGYGAAAGGINGAPAHVSEYTLRDVYAAPWVSMVQRAGLRALMRSHEQWDHWPVHASRYLPSIINAIGFNDSWSISDCGDIVNLVNFQVAANNTVAGAMALNASVDVENQCPPGCYDKLLDALDSGILQEATLNRSVARVLRHKFSAGLFDAPYTNTSLAPAVLRTPDHLALSRRAAQSSIVLLKNADATPHRAASRSAPLPLNLTNLAGKTLAVIGPLGGCAEDPNPPNPKCDGSSEGGCQAQCAHIGKTFHQIGDDVHVPTVLDVAQQAAAAEATGPTVKFARGGNVNTNASTSAFEAPAVALAAEADFILMVVGDSMESASENAKGGASINGDGGGGDRDSLDLPGTQQGLLRAVLASRKDTSVPVVVVLVNGRQVTFDAADQNGLLGEVDAVLAAWRGGEFGAEAIWDVLTGAVNPQGRLSQSWPRSIGQLGGPPSPNLHTVVADWKDPMDQFLRSYFYSDASPLFAFGYGLSYTSFSVSNASAAPSAAAQRAAAAGDLEALLPASSNVAAGTGPTNPTVATVTATVRNTGTVRGVATVQVFAHDPSNVGAVRYFWRLLAWAQVELDAGAEATVTMDVSADALAFTAREVMPGSGWEVSAPIYRRRLFGGDYTLRVAQSAHDEAAVTTTLTL